MGEAASGRKATVVGKPSPEVIVQLLRRHGLHPEEVLVVGDRLDTDVRFGLGAGAQTCLVLTGVNTQAEAAALPSSERPHHVRGCLQDIVTGRVSRLSLCPCAQNPAGLRLWAI